MGLLAGALLVLVLASSAYQALAWLSTWQFAVVEGPGRRAPAEPPGSGALAAARPRIWPGVSHLKPVRGTEAGLEDCLTSFLGQDYPGPMEVVVAARKPDKELRSLIRSLGREWPRVPLRLVDGTGPGANRKIASCVVALGEASHDILILSDADMRVEPDYLRRVVQPFSDDKVGLVTCLYAVKRASGLGAALEGLSVADFGASVLVARRVEGISFALGATMAVRREALDALGGLAPLSDHLADDFQLGNRMALAGWKVALAGTVVEDVLGPTPFGEYFSHQLRWMRTYRICRPGGHLAFLITQGLPWSLGFLAVTGFAPLGWGVFGAWLLVRMTVAYAVWRRLARTPVAGWALLAPLKDLLYLVLWLLSLVGSTVRWGEQVYRVQRDGRMEPVT